ncbi:unnamed protein product [marine sediment metagenome]|uniref:Uncharacterized protein n=1 Tax=marine sediment metagenome TaxID=412755 RepID=X1KNB7_9ZZZZ
MGFDINKFTEEFKNTIDWMLSDRHAKKIKDDLQFFKNNKNSLQPNPDSPNALRMIIELIVTKGWRLKKPANSDNYSICEIRPFVQWAELLFSGREIQMLYSDLCS